MRRVAILGAGGMGTALALLFDKGAAEVRLWSRDPEHAQQFALTRVNQRHLPGITIPESVRITADGLEAAGRRPDRGGGSHLVLTGHAVGLGAGASGRRFRS